MDGEPRKSDVEKAFGVVVGKLKSLGEHLTDDEWFQVDSSFHDSLQYARHMSRRTTVLLGLWQIVVGSLALIGLLWIYPYTETGAKVSRWFTPTTAALLAACLAGVMGSVIQTGIAFSLRAGKRTLETGYEAWYVLRPFIAGLLGTLAAIIVLGGLWKLVGTEAKPGAAGSIGIGALAGLFTDRMLQRMQTPLGATSPDKPGSAQTTPGAPPPPPSPPTKTP